MQRIKTGAVSYSNTKPLLWGMDKEPIVSRIELMVDYPANLAAKLKSGALDLALLPVAAMAEIPNSRIVSTYGIAADGPVASVCIFSKQPLEEIEFLYLDYQSRTSVRLAQLLLEKHWNKKMRFLQAEEGYISKIEGTTAGVIIGDRALEQLPFFPYIYDLGEEWKNYSGLPFIFAAWVSTASLSDEFVRDFDLANAAGLDHLEEIAADHPFPSFDLYDYYTKYIKYQLGYQEMAGLESFLSQISQH